MKQPIYIISLSSETKRRENISKQLKKLSLDFKFYDACDLRGIDESTANKYVTQDVAFNKPSRNLTKGEIGCTLSHLNLIHKINHIDSSSHLLILEDDAIIDKRISDIISSEKLNEFEWDIIILGYSKLEENESTLFYVKEPIKTKIKINDIKIGSVWKEWTCGTVGYLVNNNSLTKFNELPIVTTADDWHYIKNKLDLIICHTRPLLVFEDFQKFSSSIEDERKHLLKRKLKILDFYRYLRGIARLIMLKFRK